MMYIGIYNAYTCTYMFFCLHLNTCSILNIWTKRSYFRFIDISFIYTGMYVFEYPSQLLIDSMIFWSPHINNAQLVNKSVVAYVMVLLNDWSLFSSQSRRRRWGRTETQPNNQQCIFHVCRPVENSIDFFWLFFLQYRTFEALYLEWWASKTPSEYTKNSQHWT